MQLLRCVKIRRYDAIIAGASFAGLAVASNIEGDILLIDKKEIGTNQTSACGTFYKVIEEFNCERSILQTFDTLVLHCPEEKKIELIEPLCTFDYKKFCQMLATRVKAKKVKAVVGGIKSNLVFTDAGEFQSECSVDCTGWKAVLACSLSNGFVDKNKLSFGIETIVDYQDEEIHFFLNPKIIRKSIAWIFIGVASYVGKTDIIPELKRFLESMDLKMADLHGGYIPYGLREHVIDNIFLVGDAAGQALPLTAEGIRKSLYFGKECGKIIQKIIDKKITLKEGLKEYKNFVKKSERGYNWLLSLQNQLFVNGVPEILWKAFDNKVFSKNFQKAYLKI
ncbi:MAG: hypothetical protein ACE5KE_15675 [Methanosarcinales archaeon]